MRKSVLISWLIIIISFSGLFFSSIMYEIDAVYTMMNFEFEIYEVSIVKNDTDDIVSLRVSASIWNPSFISSFQFYKIRTRSLALNNQGFEYVRSQKWFLKDILPQENASVMWAYLNLLEVDVEILNNAEANDTWSWNFGLWVTLKTTLVDMTQYDRSQQFTGVRFISI